MPEVPVFMSETDLERVVGELLDAGCVLVPDEPSTRPEAHEIVSLEAFRICRQGRRLRLFFAVSSEWGVAPFEWGKIEKNGATQYFIRQKTGGRLSTFLHRFHSKPRMAEPLFRTGLLPAILHFGMSGEATSGIEGYA